MPAGEKVNTLNAAMTEEWDAMLATVEKDARLKAVVVMSGKEDTWVAGADIAMLVCGRARAGGRACVAVRS